MELRLEDIKGRSQNKAKRRRMLRLWQSNPKCYWCGVETVLYLLKRFQKMPDNFATLDHLRSRLNPKRSEPNLDSEERTVLACNKCNLKRSFEEVRSLPIEEKWERSSKGVFKMEHKLNERYVSKTEE